MFVPGRRVDHFNSVPYSLNGILVGSILCHDGSIVVSDRPSSNDTSATCGDVKNNIKKYSLNF